MLCIRNHVLKLGVCVCVSQYVPRFPAAGSEPLICSKVMLQCHRSNQPGCRTQQIWKRLKNGCALQTASCTNDPAANGPTQSGNPRPGPQSGSWRTPRQEQFHLTTVVQTGWLWSSGLQLGKVIKVKEVKHLEASWRCSLHLKWPWTLPCKWKPWWGHEKVHHNQVPTNNETGLMSQLTGNNVLIHKYTLQLTNVSMEMLQIHIYFEPDKLIQQPMKGTG